MVGAHSWKYAKLGMRYQRFWPLPPPGVVGPPKFGALLIAGGSLSGSGSLFPVQQFMSNCGMRTWVPSYLRTASSTPEYSMPVSLSVHLPPPLVLPVEVTYCQDGRRIAGLSELTIEH